MAAGCRVGTDAGSYDPHEKTAGGGKDTQGKAIWQLDALLPGQGEREGGDSLRDHLSSAPAGSENRPGGQPRTQASAGRESCPLPGTRCEGADQWKTLGAHQGQESAERSVRRGQDVL